MACLQKQKRASVFRNPFRSWKRELNVFTFLNLVSWLLLIQSHEARNYSRITFCYNKNHYEGKRLNTTVLKHLKALSEFDCGAHCYHNPCCRSANFRKIPSEDGRENCELLHVVEWDESGNLQENGRYDYLIMVEPQRVFDCACLPCKNNGSCQKNSKNCQCLPGFTGKQCETLGKNCYDIKNKGFDQGDGEYLIDPDGGSDDNAFQVYCDMTSFGGGWTMCYTTDEYVDIKREVSSEDAYGINGFRANCNDIPFIEVMFVDEKSKEKASFSKTGPEITFNNNYNKGASTYGQWNGHGIASANSQYQLMICDAEFYKGIHVSGNIIKCYKECDGWCHDGTSPYFRTAVFENERRKFYGVAFNENGFRQQPKRLISVGIR